MLTAAPSAAIDSADPTYSFSGTLGGSTADGTSLNVEGQITGPDDGDLTSWTITIDSQTFTQSNSTQINGSFDDGYINFNLGSSPAPFGVNGCYYLPDEIPEDDYDCYGSTMFTVNFSSPLSNSDFDMNHDGGIYERYAATVTSFLLVGANTAPVITSDGGGAAASVDVDENQTAVTTVTATDTEDEGGSPPTSLSFSISGGADSGAFDIGGASGILTFRSAPDFENPTDTGADNIYDVEVTVTDSGDLTATQAIAVTVTDVSEDTSSPAVQILGAPATLADLTPFTVTIQFSEDVTGFSADGITVGNGAASGFVAVDAHRYTVAITPTGVGDLTIDVGAGIAVDGANNPNTAATQVVVGNTIVANTRRVVIDFMSERASLITRSQPGLVNRLDRRRGATEAPFTYSANGDLSNFVAGFSTTFQHSGGLALAEIIKAAPDLSSAESGYAPFELWIDGKWAHADRGLTDTDFGALHFGIDSLINPNLVVGVMGVKRRRRLTPDRPAILTP